MQYISARKLIPEDDQLKSEKNLYWKLSIFIVIIIMFIYNKMLYIKINLVFCLIINVFVTQFSFEFHVRQVSLSNYHHNKIFYISAFIYLFLRMKKKLWSGKTLSSRLEDNSSKSYV